MAHRRSGSGVPPAPPPPSLSKHSSSRSSKPSEKKYSSDRPAETKRTRSRSKTPEEKRDRFLRTQYHKSRSRKSRSKSPRQTVGSSRNNESNSRNRPSALPATNAPQSASSSSGLTNLSSASAAKGAANSSKLAMMTPAISLISPQEFTQINRSITNPEDVKIPRRIGEGVRPIFDRPELREAIQRRMEAGDNEVNPSYVQIPEAVNQRVVAIIREPIEVMGMSTMKPPSVAVPANHTLAPEIGNMGQLLVDRYINGPLMDRRSPSPHASARSRNLSPPSRRPGSSRDLGERIRDRPIGHFKSPERLDRRSRGRSRMRSRSRSRSRSPERFVKDRIDERNISNPSLGSERFREVDRIRGQQHPRESVREIPYEEEHRRQAPPEADVRERELVRRELERDRSRNPYPPRVSRSRSRTPPPVPRHVFSEREIREREFRERDRDLRNTLSRPPGKVYHGSRPYDDDLSRNSRGNSMRNRGRGRGSSFRSRGTRKVTGPVDSPDKIGRKSPAQEIIRIRRDRETLPRGNWQHDLYDEEVRH